MPLAVQVSRRDPLFSRGVGMEHDPGRDDASPAEIAVPAVEVSVASLRARPPHRVRRRELDNGVSLYELMDEVGANALVTPQRTTCRGTGNTNPVELTPARASLGK